MKMSFMYLLVAGLFLVSCQQAAEKQYFTESEDIEVGKKILAAYLAGDWEAYNNLYADTAKIWRNANWTSDPGMTREEFVTDLQSALEPISSYEVDPQIWESTIHDDGEHWVHFWGVWKGSNSVTNKDYEIPIHLSMLIVNNQVVLEGDFYNDAEIVMDMTDLAEEAEAGDQEEEGSE